MRDTELPEFYFQDITDPSERQKLADHLQNLVNTPWDDKPTMSLYNAIIATGVKTASHYSDLYAEATPEVLAILKRHKNKNYTFFTNQVEGGQWVDNDEGLYNWWKESRQKKSEFIKENREELTACIRRVLDGDKPAHYLKYGG